MKELYCVRSQNGRYGLAIVGQTETEWPAEGALRPVGTVAGLNTFVFSPGPTEIWVFPTGDVRVHGGAHVVATEDLQGGATASILLLGPEAVVEHYGYKRRSSTIKAYQNGRPMDIPATVLAAMGIVKPDDAPAEEVPPPPPLEGAMASAFRTAFKKA